MISFPLKKKNDIDSNFLENGGTLFFIKFLHEHKQIIKNFIQSGPKRIDLKLFFKKLKRLVQYDFKTNDYLQEIPIKYIVDISTEILNYHYGLNYNIKTIFEKKMTKEYLYFNFELWWYQSLFMFGGAGYIRNINEYLKKYWDYTDNIYTEKECIEKTKLIYNRYTIPKVFTEEELRNLENYIYFYDNGPYLFDTKYINADSRSYYDGGRIF